MIAMGATPDSSNSYQSVEQQWYDCMAATAASTSFFSLTCTSLLPDLVLASLLGSFDTLFVDWNKEANKDGFLSFAVFADEAEDADGVFLGTTFSKQAFDICSA